MGAACPPSGTSSDGEERGRDADDGARAEDPRRRRAEDGALPRELGEVVVRLEDRRADAPGERPPSSW